MSEHAPLNIVMYAAEASPFAKVGGLADVVGALPKALEKLGVSVTIVLPAYKSINHLDYGIHAFRALPGFKVPMGPGYADAEVYTTKLPGTGVDVFLLGCYPYFYRNGIYDDPITKEGYPDNMERYVFFMKAGLELLHRLRLRADVIHCHDSQSALIPGLLRLNYGDTPCCDHIGTLLTIHNLAYQGIYPKDTLYWAGIDYRHFYPTSPFEFWGKVNFMKVGIEYADLISTVSENYATEIQTGPEYGYGLEGVLRLRGESLSGIVNGIDHDEWNPATDPFLPAHFSANNLSGKTVCKSELLKVFDLPALGHKAPLIGIVSRLADQKGFDLIEAGIDDLANRNLQMVILGRGQHRYHDLLQRMARRYPRKLGVRLDFDLRLAHMIQGGCDMLLMPSRYEPCGLSQLHGLRYGTVPIVRATGGLVDTVTDYSPESNSGTGFRFEYYSVKDMMNAINRALAVFSDPPSWTGLILRGMAQDWSWRQSACKYLLLYQKIKALRQ